LLLGAGKERVLTDAPVRVRTKQERIGRRRIEGRSAVPLRAKPRKHRLNLIHKILRVHAHGFRQWRLRAEQIRHANVEPLRQSENRSVVGVDQLTAVLADLSRRLDCRCKRSAAIASNECPVV